MESSSAKWISELVIFLCNLYQLFFSFFFHFCAWINLHTSLGNTYILHFFSGNGRSCLYPSIRDQLFRILTWWSWFSFFFWWELPIQPRSQSQKHIQLSCFSHRKSSDWPWETGKTAQDKQLEFLRHWPYSFKGCFFIFLTFDFIRELQLTPSHFTAILWSRDRTMKPKSESASDRNTNFPAMISESSFGMQNCSSKHGQVPKKVATSQELLYMHKIM